jgi:hypothetical protein
MTMSPKHIDLHRTAAHSVFNADLNQEHGSLATGKATLPSPAGAPILAA